jgi:hypothetical protein
VVAGACAPGEGKTSGTFKFGALIAAPSQNAVQGALFRIAFMSRAASRVAIPRRPGDERRSGRAASSGMIVDGDRLPPGLGQFPGNRASDPVNTATRAEGLDETNGLVGIRQSRAGLKPRLHIKRQNERTNRRGPDSPGELEHSSS